jgi:uncharacterized membrane protein YfcA
MIDGLSGNLWIVALAAFVFAGVIKGLVGIGMPTAAISVLAQFADPRLAIILVMAPGLITNTWQLWRSGKALEAFKKFAPFAIVMMLGIAFFAQFAARLPLNVLLVGIGTVIVLFVITSIVTPPHIPERFDLATQLSFGAISGVLGGLSAIWSPAIVMYLLARNVVREMYMAATGLLVLLGSFSLIFGYWQAGALSGELAGQSAAMILPALVGYSIGEWLRNRLDSKQFKNTVLFVFFLMGLNLLRKGLF